NSTAAAIVTTSAAISTRTYARCLARNDRICAADEGGVRTADCAGNSDIVDNDGPPKWIRLQGAPPAPATAIILVRRAACPPYCVVNPSVFADKWGNLPSPGRRCGGLRPSPWPGGTGRIGRDSGAGGFLVRRQGLEPRTRWLRASCSAN